MVTVKYFAWLRERIGVAEEELNIPDDVLTVKEFVDWLIERGEQYAYGFEQREYIKVAVNQHQVDDSFKLDNPREIAFFPPMTGG